MTRKLSLIIGIAVTALAFGVPTAFGEGPRRAADGVAYFYANERATLDFPSSTITATRPRRSPQWRSSVITATRPRRRSCSSRPQWVIRDHGDATQATLLLQSPPMGVIRDHGDATQAKLVEQGSTSVGSSDQVALDPNSLSTPTVSASSGSEIEWPQLGIGFGLGILLVAGLWLAIRMTKGHPLAH